MFTYRYIAATINQFAAHYQLIKNYFDTQLLGLCIFFYKDKHIFVMKPCVV